MKSDCQLIIQEYAKEIAAVEHWLGSKAWKRVDAIDEMLAELPQVRTPLNHVFTKGLYTRSIFVPAKTLVTSRIHLTEHPFIISMGVVSVWTKEKGCETYHAFHQGVTKPGTRRVLFTHTDIIWTTIHPNPKNRKNPNDLMLDITYTGGKFSALGLSEDERFPIRKALCTN